MCQSKAEGGQRCYGHARTALTTAEARHQKATAALAAATARNATTPTALTRLRTRADSATERLHTRLAEYASTWQGEQDLRTEIADAETRGNPDPHRAATVHDAITKGKAIAERNAAVKAAVRAARNPSTPWSRETLMAIPGENMTVPANQLRPGDIIVGAFGPRQIAHVGRIPSGFDQGKIRIIWEGPSKSATWNARTTIGARRPHATTATATAAAAATGAGTNP